MRPLDRIPSIKLKLGILIVAAVAVSATMSQVGFKLGWPVWLRPVVAACVSLLMVQFLAHGMTSPLREMAKAADAMARGTYSNRVRATSHDEVGDLARSFNSMADDLTELDAQRRAFVGNAAHELRTPITGLQATLENLADGVVDPSADVLDRLRSQVDRLSHLVGELLDLSRLESPATPRSIEPVNMSDVVEAVLCRVRAEQTGAILDAQCTTDRTIDGDPELLDRLVHNLVRNAMIHGEARDVRIRVDDEDGVVLRVSDRGPGFAADDADHIFDRFYRGESARGDGRPGAGLGLAISRAIVAQHNASISAGANSPGGCVVTVTFPAASTSSIGTPEESTT